MPLRTIVNIRIGLIILAAALALFGFRNGFVAVFFQAKHEVTWDYDTVVLFCHQGQCAYSASLTFANTGRETQELFTVQLEGVPPYTGGSARVTNLSAMDPRANDPEITETWGGGTANIEVRNFAPGALIEVWIRGSFHESEKPGEDEPIVTVSGKGRMINGDPRAVAFGRFIT